MKKEKEKPVEKRDKFPVAQKAIIYDEKQDKFLLLKKRDGNDYLTKHYGVWEFPGGKVENGENLTESLLREIREELGDVEVEKVAPINTVRSASSNSHDIVFIDYLVRSKGGKIKISDEHSELRWESAEAIEKSKEYQDWIKKVIRRAVAYLENEKIIHAYQRIAADFENYKKRQAEEKKDLLKYCNANLISEILPVVDNFHASTGHIPEDQKDSPWVVGIMHIQRQLEQALSDNGASEIPVKAGDKFDPEIHEALAMVENGVNNDNIHPVKSSHSEVAEGEFNRVKKIIQKGYKMGERVIRPARVIVE